MNWSDYEAVWKRQPPPVGKAADIGVLRETFEAKRRKVTATLLVRNTLEGFGGVVFAIVFSVVAWRIGRAGWPILIGAGLILGVSLVFIRDWLRIRRSRLGPEAPLLARLEAEISELRHQRRLIARIGLWYFLPYLAAIAIIGTTLARASHRAAAPPDFLLTLITTPATLAWIVILVGVSAAAIFWAWRANRNAVRKQIDPRLEELEKLRGELMRET